MLQVFTMHFPPACDLCRFSQIFTSQWLDTSRHGWNFASLIWLSGKAAWNFLFRSLLPISRTCLFIHSQLSLYLNLQFLVSVLVFAFCFSLFPDCSESLIRYPFLFLLWLDGSSCFSGQFQQDCLGTFPEIFWGYLILCNLQYRKPVGQLCCKLYCFLFFEYLEIRRRNDVQVTLV